MKKVTIILMLIISSAVYAQQDPLFTHYMFNKLAFNPAYAGSREVFSMELINRLQWVGIDRAPRTISFTAHTQLKNPHLGIGLYAYRDEVGPTVDYGAMGSFAFRVLFPTSKLCFGVQAGFKHFDIDWDALDVKDPGDNELVNSIKSKVVPDVDFGIYYYGARFYAGVSSKHLLQNQMVASTSPVDNKTSFTRLLMNFYGIGGVAIPFSDNVVFLPSVLVKYVANAPVQTDINASFLLHDVVILGASFRTDQALGLLIEVNITKNLSMGYSYDIWFNSLKAYNSGSHELRIGYDLDLFDKNRMLTPRYF
jgi:type IX secretion system PorP/SprF family membrane protein